ncbi:conserved Plasmodium protein, unknown function [Plasmodium ovale]|uniref:Kelch domain-containing protein n=3 Tax=Plasmodium ovale TaxID=36330 RepID=A0A1A8WWH9_PLAOA|nr:hypothetical protein, conserved [Plasmodium ovale curtisi]SCP05981.1 conserved Plasmodium protein, unknown function [Plasmodium ovale]
MNIISYLYNKSKSLYNRSVSAYNYNNIENENLISNFADHSNSYSNNSCTSKSSSHTLMLSSRNSEKRRKKKCKGKKKKKKEEGSFMASYLNKSGKFKRESEEKKIKISNSYDKSSSRDSERKMEEEVKNSKMYQSENNTKYMNENKNNSNSEFNIDTIAFDAKVYKNRCDGVCVLNDNIYIFDKIKKCIYLYTPYNNIWYIFLNIYEEMSIKKYNNFELPVYSIKDEGINRNTTTCKYLNNISFINYTDVTLLNECIFIISSNSQFMNICKVNVNNMNTLFGTIVVDMYKNVTNFTSILDMLKRNSKYHPFDKSTILDQDQKSEEDTQCKRKFTKIDSRELPHEKEHMHTKGGSAGHIDRDSLVSKISDETGSNRGGSTHSQKPADKNENKADVEGEKKEEHYKCRKPYTENELDDPYEYVNGVTEFYEFLENDQNSIFKKKKKIIKARDFFSVCSVNESSYSLIYLFGGKGSTFKEKNEYIDIIYNDLYVYDFFKNKWIELYEYRSNNGHAISSKDGKDYQTLHVQNITHYRDNNSSYENGNIHMETGNSPFDFKSDTCSIAKNEKKDVAENATLTEDKNSDDFLPFFSSNDFFSSELDFPQMDRNKNEVGVHRSLTCENVPSSATIATIATSTAVNNVSSKSDCHDEELFGNFRLCEELRGEVSPKEKRAGDLDLYSLLFDSSNGETAAATTTVSTEAVATVGGVTGEGISQDNTVEQTNFFCEQIEGPCIDCMNKKKCKYVCDMVKNDVRIRRIKWLGRRAGHTCAYYKNNLYIFGGINYYSFNSNDINLNFCNNLYVYNIETNECFEVIGKGTIPEKRYRHSCTIINDRMFILGGECKNSTLPKNDLFFYNFENSVWSEITLNSKIGAHALYKTVWLENFGSIYMFGSSIVRLTKKNFQYTPSYRNDKKKAEQGVLQKGREY